MRTAIIKFCSEIYSTKFNPYKVNPNILMPIKSVVAVLFLLLYWRMLIEFLDKELIVIIESVSELFALL